MITYSFFTDIDMIPFWCVRQINKLVVDSVIGEPFDFGNFLCVANDNGEVVGVIVYRLEKYDDEIFLPRFIHIVLADALRSGKSKVVFLMKAEKNLMLCGYKKVWAYIKGSRINMLILARKFGFKDTDFDGVGYTLLKKIGD